MNQKVARPTDRLLLWPRQAPFQAEFGPEMLRNFDEEPGAAAYLLFHGALSLLRQLLCKPAKAPVKRAHAYQARRLAHA